MQSVKDGTLTLVEAPSPGISPTEVLVATRASLISSGTERAVRELASSSLVSKALARPDLVRQTLRRVRTDGITSTLAAVRGRLSEDMPLGYSAAGEVLEVGEAVPRLQPGARVATAGAGHGEVQLVAGTLVARLPDDVGYEDAAFATVGAVALNSLRLAGITAGDRILIVGLGLVGQLAGRLAAVMGANVAGMDVDPWKLEMATGAAMTPFANGADGWESVMSWTKGVGLDAVIVAASTKSSEPMNMAAAHVRDHGTVVLVGDAGMELDRRPLYEREVTVRVARSYGPGRYDPVYEELGVDYPIGQARWTAGRNLETIVGLLASGRLAVGDLITHRFSFDDAIAAYDFLEGGFEPSLGIILNYTKEPGVSGPIAAVATKSVRVSQYSAGLIGAGRFARETLLPMATAAGFGPWRSVASSRGTSAQGLAVSGGFERAAVDANAVITDPSTSVIFIASHHDSHAAYVEATLAEGKHVFCEKPLAITETELNAVEAAWQGSGAVMMVGFNRRWSPVIAEAKAFLGEGPVQMTYRVKAGTLPPDHWLKDRRQGGRLLGEACHFIDLCNYLAAQNPTHVYCSSLGDQELLLDDNFSLSISYPNGSQALIAYSAMTSTQGGKERVEILGQGRAVDIDDFRRVEFRGSGRSRRRRYRTVDKGHRRELEVFAEAIRGERDPTDMAHSAFVTSRTAFAAVHSLMTGEAARV
jgi:predicted dehydrogenase/threonine dehydrogenase-like Zn-dependent dehydrogenase